MLMLGGYSKKRRAHVGECFPGGARARKQQNPTTKLDEISVAQDLDLVEKLNVEPLLEISDEGFESVWICTHSKRGEKPFLQFCVGPSLLCSFLL